MSRATTIRLRSGAEIADPLAAALAFLGEGSSYDVAGSVDSRFGERDLRHANGGGARIAATQIAEILKRRRAIEAALRELEPEASLAARRIPWIPLRRLFDSFDDLPGVGLSKATKALYPKRPALVPMLDSVVCAYLKSVDSDTGAPGTLGERAIAFVRSYKRELDENVAPLRRLRRELARRGHAVTEVRILDLLIWTVARSPSGQTSLGEE